jgi:MFS family permease
MQVVALGYLVYQRTGSTTAVAVVAAADGIPSVILSLAGGVLADRLPRRRILLVTQSLLGLSAGTLAVLVATNHATFVAILVVAIVPTFRLARRLSPISSTATWSSMPSHSAQPR